MISGIEIGWIIVWNIYIWWLKDTTPHDLSYTTTPHDLSYTTAHFTWQTEKKKKHNKHIWLSDEQGCLINRWSGWQRHAHMQLEYILVPFLVDFWFCDFGTQSVHCSALTECKLGCTALLPPVQCSALYPLNTSCALTSTWGPASNAEFFRQE